MAASRRFFTSDHGADLAPANVLSVLAFYVTYGQTQSRTGFGMNNSSLTSVTLEQR